ncbi:hypothetical protein LZ518_12710 [Sphingomonas sp. RB56-2]|uniref:Uncharacterized protein n=1 Tax=Sphingomonas brevis TaxID=2908206 RepID=A0ABT0SC43_9SPHN|nr:hypothetical protein [Sphingomonas brevis]MCL6741991.1 hypothetical protein [Sphingomonas brevis]
MWRFAALFPFLGFLALLACAKQDPVDDNAVAPPVELSGDVSAAGLAAPANAAAAEAIQQAALPSATGGLKWAYRATDRTALFGPPGTPAFSIQCDRQREGDNQLVFVRYLPPTGGGNATLSFTGNGKAASVPIAAVTDTDGRGGQWRASVSVSDSVRDIAEAFAGPGTVNVSLTGLAPLVVPATAEPRRALAECLRG